MVRKESLYAAALCWATLVYCGVMPLPRSIVRSVVPLSAATGISGIVVSNPAKTTSGRYYRFNFTLCSVTGIVGGFSVASGAGGTVAVLFPAAILEANFPGKLYSAASARSGQESRGDFFGASRRGNPVALSNLLVETGVRLTLTGKLLPPYEQRSFLDRLQGEKPVFLAETLESAAYDGNFSGGLARVRGWCRLQFRRVMYAWGGAGGLFLALASGASEYTDSGVGGLFRNAGLSHVLALSGMHLSIFSGVTRRAGKRAGKRRAELLALGVVLLFVWFAGWTPSLRRALIFFMLGFAAKRVGKVSGMTEMLTATFFIHFFWKPEEAATLSFILSYAGLAGILVFSGLFNRLLVRIPGFFCSGGFAASIGAFIATSPVSALFFHYVTPGSILSSTVISPLITVFMLCGIICSIAALVYPPLVFTLGTAMNLVYRLIIIPTGLFARIPRIPVG